MNYLFRKATVAESAEIWEILQGAVSRRRQDGSTQWQDGYPNLEVVRKDIEKEAAYVLALGEEIVA